MQKLQERDKIKNQDFSRSKISEEVNEENKIFPKYGEEHISLPWQDSWCDVLGFWGKWNGD